VTNYFNRTKQIFYESIKGFFEDKCYLHASSLTFYTLLSIVPILAVAFGLAKGFGFERNLEEELYKRLSEHREIVDLVVDFARSLLVQAESSYIAGIGVIFLFLFVISLFWTIEASLNAIWKVNRSRPFLRIITDYLAMMIICPFFFVIASSLTVYVTGQIGEVLEQHSVLHWMSPLLLFTYRGITLALIWLLFTCVYIIMPNTRVPTRYAMLAGIMAGTMYYFVLIGLIRFQIGVSQYNAIYGSFAALPLFLFWLQISWLIVLFGAEIAYHAEHLSPMLKSFRQRTTVTSQLLAVLLTSQIVRAFKKGAHPWTLNALAEHFGISQAPIQHALAPLIEEEMIAQYKSDNSDIIYQPARDVEALTLYAVIHSSNPLVSKTIRINEFDDCMTVSEKIRMYERDSQALAANIPVYQLHEDPL